jgi:hypothetical protein
MKYRLPGIPLKFTRKAIQPKAKKQRAKSTFDAYEDFRLEGRDMGRRLGQIRVSAFTLNKKRLEASLGKDPYLRQRIQRLSKVLESKASE